jgi:hypothetical protein
VADSATEIRNGGKGAATSHLLQVHQIFGPSTSVLCAEGMLDAVVEHVRRLHGPKAAFDLLVKFSDAVGAAVAEPGK